MKVAICNDNIADRQQLERILKRLQSSFEDLQAESFGSPEALVPTCLRFDIVFIDIVPENGFTALNVFHVLRNKGCTAPVYVTSNDEILENAEIAEGLYYIEKPYMQEDFSKIIAKYVPQDKVIEKVIPGQKRKQPTVTEDEILYVAEVSGHLSSVLTGNRTTASNSTFAEFELKLNNFKNLVKLKNKLAINTRRIKKLSFCSIRMENDAVFFCSPSKIKKLKGMINND